MMDVAIAWPKKTRELHNHHMDSTLWNGFDFRDDDIVVATYAKSGTTWTQQIVGQLVFGGAEDVAIHELSPWWDLRIMPPEARDAVRAQTHRRIIKTHLPVDALVFSPKAKYVYIARDGRDVVWSLYNHHAKANQLWYDALNDTPGRVGPPIDRPDPDIRRYFLHWLETDGEPFWSFSENIASWWEAKDLPNVKLLHYNNLKDNLEGEVRSLAKFLEIEVDPLAWPKIVHHCTFEHMKENAEKVSPLGGAIFEGGAKSFINKGVNGRWKDVLTPEDNARYEALMVERLGADAARWLETGKL